MAWLWIALGAFVVLAGVRLRQRLRAARASTLAPAVDDAAVRHIIAEGRLPSGEEDAPLDMEEIARAEEEFWAESWDEPEEYRS